MIGAWLGVGLALVVSSTRRPEGPLDRVRLATVLVRSSEATGSGAVVRSSGGQQYLLTNHHVIASGGELQVVYFAGTPEEWTGAATLVVSDPGHDLALLRTTGPARQPRPLAGTGQVSELMRVVIAGFPFGDALQTGRRSPAPTLTRASISSLRRGELGELEVVQVDNALNPGNSGGPVTNEAGEIVGISVAALKGASIGFLIPWEQAEALLQGRAAIPLLRAPPGCGRGCEASLEVLLLDPFHLTTGLELRRIEADEAFLHRPRPDGPQAREGELLTRADRPSSGSLRVTVPLTLIPDRRVFVQVGYRQPGGTSWGLPFELLGVPEPGESRRAPSPAPPEARPPTPGPAGDAIPGGEGPGIHILQATYGRNCGARPANATGAIAAACSGRSTCSYVVDFQVLGDPSPGCAKTFDVEWRCGASSAARRAELPGEAGFQSRLQLGCEGPPSLPPEGRWAIRVLEATYGANCGAPTGNATAALRGACDGRERCQYVVDYRVLGDPARDCRKTFRWSWTCGTGQPTRTQLAPAEAGMGSVVPLSCP